MTRTRSDGSPPPPDSAQMAPQAMASWVDALIAVLESMTGSRPKAESRAVPADEVWEGLAWWGHSLSIQEQPSFWIGAPADSWADLGRLTLAALGVKEATDIEIGSTCRDLMAQTSSITATSLASQFSNEIAAGDVVPDSQPNPDGAFFFTWSLDAGTTAIEGVAVWSGTFLRDCCGLTAQRAAGASEQATPVSGSDGVRLGGQGVDSLPRLDLKVKFILGRATLPLRDVFKLNVGSVIQLDHSAVEPADVVIRDRVLARGQVVVVNGNYGLKILPHQQ